MGGKSGTLRRGGTEHGGGGARWEVTVSAAFGRRSADPAGPADSRMRRPRHTGNRLPISCGQLRAVENPCHPNGGISGPRRADPPHDDPIPGRTGSAGKPRTGGHARTRTRTWTSAEECEQAPAGARTGARCEDSARGTQLAADAEAVEPEDAAAGAEAVEPVDDEAADDPELTELLEEERLSVR